MAEASAIKATPEWFRYLLAVFFTAMALLGFRYAQRCWRVPTARSGLEPPMMWPYSRRRWENAVRAMAWNIGGWSLVMLGITLVQIAPHERAVSGVVLAMGMCLLLSFLVLTALGRPKRLLSHHF